MSTDFENKCKDISCTELWKIFREKCSEEEFVVAVGKVCEFGIEKSKAIIKFFPNFTLHDLTHIKNVCNWMTALLGKRADELTAQDAAMLLMSACCHDIGMSVSAEQEKKLEEEYNSKAEQREYVRLHHHERVGEHLTTKVWGEKLDTDKALKRNGIRRKDLIDLCKSHGEDLEKPEVPANSKYDPRLCTVLLRLADILDFDSSRAPQSLFEHMGLNAPEDSESVISQIEWIKNSSGSFEIIDGELVYTAEYSDPNIEHKVNEYLKWVKQEIEACREYISEHVGNWNNLRLPYRIKTNIDRTGYEGGDFHITMDQERIINLLAGENLYSDSCVFVRELLQNSIDAILWRGENDPYFDAKKDGKIKITTWHDETGQGWFKIEDNGTGMDENIIKNYFLRAGRSYYTSDDFEKERDIYSHNKTYKPISRFGIGILSCFMSDKNNKLEVSTKRYSHDIAIKNPGLRLSVTGLKGYYSLAKENKQGVCDWQKMPVQKGEKEEYFRTEPGTTICVGMNLFDLGDYRSIKEVVDKYVQFPDMKVEYHGFDGAETYPTKDEFMEAIAELKKEHGDTCPIVCKHPIPDKEFEKLKAHYPEFEWESVPELVFEYYPLDNYTSGDSLCGISVIINVNANYKKGLFDYKNVTYRLGLDSYAVFFKSKIEIRFIVTLPIILKEKSNFYNHDRRRFEEGILFPINMNELLSESENLVIKYAVQKNTAGNNGVTAYDGVTAYNGMYADVIRNIPFNGNNQSLLLLSGKYAPEVNVARNSITKLPLEASAELSIIEKKINKVSFSYHISYDYYFTTEKEIHKLIEKHPEWEAQIILDIEIIGNNTAIQRTETIQQIKERVNHKETIFLQNFSLRLYNKIALSYLKKHIDLISDGVYLQLIPKTNDNDNNDTIDLPFILFFRFSSKSEVFASLNNLFYNPEHNFSQWLIQNREKLEKELPTVYRKILEIMIMSGNKTDVMNGLNNILTQLKSYRNNHFGISDDLYLTEDDFA